MTISPECRESNVLKIYVSFTDMFHFVSQSSEFEVDMQIDEIRFREVHEKQ